MIAENDAQSLDGRTTEGIGDELAIVAARIAAAMGRFLELLAEIDRRDGWANQGCGSLAEVAEILRHRHPDTTALYAKVDLHALRTVAPRWPGVRRR